MEELKKITDIQPAVTNFLLTTVSVLEARVRSYFTTFIEYKIKQRLESGPRVSS